MSHGIDNSIGNIVENNGSVIPRYIHVVF